MNSTSFAVFALALAIAAPACDRDHDKDRDGRSGTVGTIQDVTEGQHVRVLIDGSTYPYAATQVEILATGPEAAAEEGAIEGAVKAIDPAAGTLTVLGVKVTVDSATELRGLGDLAELAVGHDVRIRGRAGADGVFVASRIELRPARIEGIVFARVPEDDRIKVGVLGKTVVLDAETEVMHREPTQCKHRDHDDDDHHDDDDDD